MANFLTRIEQYKRAEIAAAKQRTPLAELERRASDAEAPRGFLAAIEKRLTAGGYALITELKKASPSKGLIRTDFDPPALARDYERGGATCLSVLTDVKSFQGGPEHLTAARAATSLPVLRKDFMYDVYQVFQARAWGADCILITLATVSDTEAQELEEAAFSLGMDALVEIHNEAELARAVGMRSRLVGINNKDLRTFETSLSTTETLAPGFPPDRVVVGESGLSTRADLDRLAKAGVCTFLIGESLMRAPDVERATAELVR
ncbi:indole-3-glycerol phosphate synthase TrpC [Saccharopolyspora sp. ASAGF58]|uniref:indole-3-glycerol phosphate synthase TrpC n=1 Tax=Saccharopolyspora sp. ASAGF58 TaxID=2719023 RepID=UPI00143FBB1A|nr:indole-3-glycerol phosphate synthase TrpC [Saccharopolyspora sp. ASAGF58]QIZ36320.1 indole-3-glycerol phosphate synthase TrpC [Saccharopolyspora sp. ASAGF58]